MKEILERIFSVQKLDTAIRRLEEAQARIPVERGELDSRVAASEKEISRLGHDRQEKDKARRALEQQVEDTTLLIRKHQKQLYEVKTNKEYTAMLHEIEHEKGNISGLEERILSLMEEAEGLAEEERRALAGLDTVRRTAEAEKAGLEARASEIASELAQAAQSRASALEGLPTEILVVYHRVAKSRNGVAVVPIRGAACGGCFANLPTKVTDEVRRMEELITCEACGRILVWQPAESNGTGPGNGT